MVKIFRNIRERSIFGNKLSKYFTYAIGEIILVVIGIFLAIQLNDLNQDRINKKNEAKILTGLQKEFQAANKELETDDSARKNILEIAGNVLAVHKGAETIAISSDSVGGFFSRFLAYRFYTTAHPVLDDLMTSGRLNLIESDKLRYAISTYMQEKNRYAIIEERERLFVENQLTPYFSNYFDLSAIQNNEMSTERVDNTLKSIPHREKHGSILNQRILYTQQAINYGARVTLSIKAVLNEIDAVIKEENNK